MALFDMGKTKITSNLLSDRYIVNPFSVLDAKSGSWRVQRQFWYDLLDTNNDIRHEIQITNNTPGARKDTADYASDKFSFNIGTSLFDPFLCEIVYRWFSLSHMSILDPFAGGHARGMVACMLGRHYLGFDINKKQIQFNEQCKKEILERTDVEDIGDVTWLHRDAREIATYHADFDMMFTCPPYYNLEVYTQQDNDLSRCKSYDEFMSELSDIFKYCYGALKEDSFAVVVVGDIRDTDGVYYGFVADTIKSMQKCGFKFYNDIVLENTIGSLPVRCPRYFDDSRKVGKQHQNVLVFYKGNTKNIHNKFGNFT